MGRRAFAYFALLVSSAFISGAADHKHLFLCRSPLLAFDFQDALRGVRDHGVKLTPQIAQQICETMRAGSEPQCIRVESDSFKPIAAGWGGALALTDGKTRVWFHNPDTGGWVTPEYYVSYVNAK